MRKFSKNICAIIFHFIFQFSQVVHVNVDEIVVKKEDTTKEDLLSDTIQNTSTTELINQDPLEVVGAPVKKEDTTEEDPLSDTIQNTFTTELMDQDPLEVVGAPVKKEKIEEDDEITVKEKLQDITYIL